MNVTVETCKETNKDDEESDPEEPSSFFGQTELYYAVHSGDESLVKSLLERGFDPNECCQFGDHLLLFASKLKKPNKSFRLLLEYGADPNLKCCAKLKNCLIDSIQRGDVETVRMLLDHNADPNVLDGFEQSQANSVDVAVALGHVHIVNLLLDFGGQIDRIDEEFGTFPLLVAAGRNDLGMIRALLNRGADINQVSWSGTALYGAASWGYLEAAKLLFQNGADVNKSAAGLSPLICSISSGKERLVEFLIAHGADVNLVDWDEWSPLRIAYTTGRPDIVQMLIDAKAKHSVEEVKIWSRYEYLG
eukprot:TRINITY_DN6699_c0_g1_i1.p1 TRINITY_DN6699_c0_g1~~TRINITY_DN6699_c0_g1_i1.p1  ORF type:complete len:305 (-),score=82.98 TRINITY_DN6699_c0_g1_i1:41-955(-)